MLVIYILWLTLVYFLLNNHTQQHDRDALQAIVLTKFKNIQLEILGYIK
jgi:hypothetical protein